MLLVSAVLVPVLVGILVYLVPLKLGKRLVLLTQAFLAWLVVTLFQKNAAYGSFLETLGGDDPILYISLRGDRTSLIFLGLSVLLFAAVFIYSMRYEPYTNKKLLLFMLVLQGVVQGIFLTDDLFNLFVLIEVATIIAIVLILFKRDGRDSYDGLFYMVMQVVTMMFFLFGIAYVYRAFGVLSFTQIGYIIQSGVPRDALILPFAFLITGIALKIGMFPLFSWVTHAYGNPSTPFPVLAILSGLVVKNNLFFVVRLHHLFMPILDFSRFFIALGILTAIAGAVKALAQKDIKLMLAFSTVSQIGLITVGLFIGNETAFYGSIMHIINHAIFKALLFLTSGMIARTYQTVHVDEINGLFKRMPLVGVATFIGILGIIGFPFLNGSMSKYWIMAEASPLMELVFWIMNTGTILVFVKYGTILFGGSEARTKKDPIKIGVVLFLSTLTLLFGVFGLPLAYFLFGIALPFSLSSFLVKGALFLAVVAGAILVYRYVLAKSTWLYKFAKSAATVQTSTLILLLFFASMLIYGALG